MRSKYQLKEIRKLKRASVALYRTGKTVREVGRMVGKSHTWVANAVKGK